ncbi:uncharacterized protein LOC133526412 isoform X2 [Cydia pomonella]|uniref:uncharacterized protein LOC133526412 isoform X2 n=1 Tax=Cydia pomonella TaxID=82600 RepID=UPI002ADDB8B7|nr:uncharacterized protein LOC133526412 isoform X2 [Cydia pomonella]
MYEIINIKVQFLLVYRSGYPESVFENANYTGADQRELPPEPRPDFRMESNFVLVNRDQSRRLGQTWAPVNETFFEGVNNVMQPFVNNTEDMFGPADRRVVGADRLANMDRNSSAHCRADEELEQELEALARRIDTEFKSAD